MNESILNSIKKLLGPSVVYDAFDDQIIIHINSVLRLLNQLGVGERGFSITGSTETWADFIPDDTTDFDAVISYTYQKVRLLFDPPQNSFLVNNIEKLCSELEWRLNVQADPGDML
jgi:hypothetical protein